MLRNFQVDPVDQTIEYPWIRWHCCLDDNALDHYSRKQPVEISHPGPPDHSAVVPHLPLLSEVAPPSAALWSQDIPRWPSGWTSMVPTGPSKFPHQSRSATENVDLYQPMVSMQHDHGWAMLGDVGRYRWPNLLHPVDGHTDAGWKTRSWAGAGTRLPLPGVPVDGQWWWGPMAHDNKWCCFQPWPVMMHNHCQYLLWQMVKNGWWWENLRVNVEFFPRKNSCLQ